MTTNANPNLGVPVEDWQHRVVAEYDELFQKVQKLGAYLDANGKTLQKYILKAMIAQLDAMCTYADTLQMRIRLFNAVVTDEESENFDYPITSISEMGNYVLKWHADVLSDIKHLQDVPEGTGVALAVNEEATPDIPQLILTGDTLRAFKAGVLAAEALMTELPFQKNEVSPAAAAANGLDVASLEIRPMPEGLTPSTTDTVH